MIICQANSLRSRRDACAHFIQRTRQTPFKRFRLPLIPGSSSNGVGLLAQPNQQDSAQLLKGNRKPSVEYQRIHHVGLLCEKLERSLEFYLDVLGMEVRKGRPHNKLPYRGEWLSIGDEMIHLMELPNPDPTEGRPKHGGRDRHFCISVASIAPIEERLKAAGVDYTASASGRAALFFRDPDSNVLECAENGGAGR